MSGGGTKRTWKVAPGDEVVPGRRVIQRLGGGRRTEVYRCTDDATGAHVAVKILRPGRTGGRDVRMLRREAQVLGMLDHPGFPDLLAQDLEADPAWIVLSHAGGTRLSGLVRDGTVDVERAARLARDVGGALAHLHGHGHVHLDVKPSNVVLGRRCVLVDLGACRPLDRTARLRPGVGTVSYLSPEQADPQRFGPPVPASDVWGLGICLLEATTGTNPLVARREQTGTGETGPDSTGPDSAAGAVDETELAGRCRAAAAAVPDGLRDLVLHCLATSPTDRPGAAEVAQRAPQGAGVREVSGTAHRRLTRASHHRGVGVASTDRRHGQGP